MLTEKAYDATVRLGVATTTDDAEGEVDRDRLGRRTSTRPTVRAAFAEQVGDLEQVPTAVSAIKVDGKRAYQRVRDGEEVELEPRPVTVHELTVTDVRRAGEHVDVDLSLRCSSGTYVRAIARDVGAALGVGGHLTALRRTAVGPYGLERRTRSTSWPRPSRCCRSPTPPARRSPRSTSTRRQAADVRVGRALDLQLDGLTAVFAPDGEFLALYEPRDGVPAPSRSSSDARRSRPCRSGAPSTRCRPTWAAPSW